MIVSNKINDLREILKLYRMEQKSIGFVPTMGYLHEGHRALLKKARKENEIVVLSIFVNPLQFGPNEDLSTYPRDFDRDIKTAEEENVDIIFHPSVQEMYPNDLSITMNVIKRTDVLCGASRPGHFDGVATVLTKLFHIIQPDNVYFGKKDAQQVAVVDALIRDFNFPLEVVSVETVREHDGLAKSSRNVFLTESERKEAPILFQSLKMGASLIENGEEDPQKVVSSIAEMVQVETSGEIDYVNLLTYPNLEKVDRIKGQVIIAIAVKFSKARLIDNIILTKQ